MADSPKLARARRDRELLESILTTILGRPLNKAKRGERQRAYRILAGQLGVSPSAPRMWMSRAGRGSPLGVHLRNRLEHAAGIVHQVAPPRSARAGRESEEAQELIAQVRQLYDVTGGRGPLWQMVTHVLTVAKEVLAARGKV